MKKIEFLGVGAGFSVGLGNTSAMIYDKIPENGFIMIDCGEQARMEIVNRGLFTNLKGVIITHLHGDHIFGLELLGFYWYFVRKEKLVLYLPSEQLSEELKSLFILTMKQVQDNEGRPVEATFDDFFNVKVIGQLPLKIDNCQYTFKTVPHVPNKESYGLIIENEGRSHIYSSDISRPIFDLDWYKSINNINYIWHDCQLYDGGKGSVHCYLGALQKFKNKKLGLMHYNKTPSDEELRSAQEWCHGFIKKGEIFEL